MARTNCAPSHGFSKQRLDARDPLRGEAAIREGRGGSRIAFPTPNARHAASGSHAAAWRVRHWRRSVNCSWSWL